MQAAVPAGTTVVAPAERPHLSRFETNHEDLAKDAADADAMMGWVLPPGILDAATRLRALVWLHAGCDELDFGVLTHTPEIRAWYLAMGTESLAAFARGEPMPRTVDLDLGC
jgi:phosphoglycerate dehydrogenase-like enzyme